MVKRIVNYLGNPENVKRLKMPFYITITVIVIADFIVHREHAAFIWDKIPGWSAFYGFVSCIILIFVYKVLGYGWLMKKEDYYD